MMDPYGVTARFPQDHDRHEHYPRLSPTDITVCVFVFLVVGLLLLVAAWHYRPTPQPLPMQPIVVDTGWHMAIDPLGETYYVPLRYDQMNDVQRDDANRYGRQHPDGE